MRWSSLITFALAATFAGPLAATAQLPLEPGKNSGLNVTAAYEGWFRSEDGSLFLLVGYFNRNHKEVLEIPIGANNRIEPGGPDRGQPTHFLPRRAWGVFTIPVPSDFGNGVVTWHLEANGKPTEIPFTLKPEWEVEPLRDPAQDNAPPSVRFATDGAWQQGPPIGIAATFTAKAEEPFALTAWAKDDGVVDEFRLDRAIDPPVTLFWSKYRGPGTVTFDNDRPEVSKEDASASTSVTFSEPGEYMLRLQANDITGENGGFQCCWTNAHVTVTVTPNASSSPW